MPNAAPLILLSMTLLAADPIGPAAPGSEPGSVAPARVIHADASSLIPGVTRPAREATLGVPFDATIAGVRVAEGGRVRAGDIVVMLDDRVAREALRVSEVEASHTAAVDRARAEFERASESFDRAEQASDSGAMGAERLSEARHRRDTAAADLRFAQETLERARAQLALTRAQLDEHAIRAPFGGVVARVHAEAGEVVSPGQPLVDLIDPHRSLVDLYLPAGEALLLGQGDRVALRLGTPLDAVVNGIVRFVEPRVDPAAGAVRVVLGFDAPDASVPGGVLVTLADRLPGDRDATRLALIAEARTRMPGTRSSVASVSEPAEAAPAP